MEEFKQKIILLPRVCCTKFLMEKFSCDGNNQINDKLNVTLNNRAHICENPNRRMFILRYMPSEEKGKIGGRNGGLY